VNDEAVVNPSELKGTTSSEEGPTRLVTEDQAAEGRSNGGRRTAVPSRGENAASTTPRKVPASAKPKIIAKNQPAEPITKESSHAREPPTANQPARTLRERDLPPEPRKEQVPLTGEATELEQPTLTEHNPPPATQSKPAPPEVEKKPSAETPGETQEAQNIPAVPRINPSAASPPTKAQAPNPTRVSPKLETTKQPGGEQQQPALVCSDDVEDHIEPRIPDETVEVKSTFQEVPVSPLGLFNNFIQLGRAGPRRCKFPDSPRLCPTIQTLWT
jgi:hypothetical protein